MIWSLSGEPLATLHYNAPVEYAEFSPDGTKVVTVSGDRTALVWSVATGNRLTEEPLEHDDTVLTARFSDDGLRVITASSDATAQLWDVHTGLELSDPFRHAGAILSAAFSLDGRRAIMASLDNTAAIWEVPVVDSPVPSWLPPLAEAIGGLRPTASRNRCRGASTPP